MKKDLTVVRKGTTHYGQIPPSVGFSATSGNSTGLTDKQKAEQAENIKNWQSGKSQPFYE